MTRWLYTHPHGVGYCALVFYGEILWRMFA